MQTDNFGTIYFRFPYDPKQDDPKLPRQCYAIEAGGVRYITPTWDECQMIRDANPSKARYKKCQSVYEAMCFLGAAATKQPEAPATDPDAPTCVIYTDGSWDNKTRTWGYGFVLFDANNEAKMTQDCGSGKEYGESRNIAGETKGAVEAVKAAIIKGYKVIHLYHDYIGLAEWAHGSWDAKTAVARWYSGMMRVLQQDITIVFHHVKGHTGDKWNEYVDKLAKSALGLE